MSQDKQQPPAVTDDAIDIALAMGRERQLLAALARNAGLEDDLDYISAEHDKLQRQIVALQIQVKVYREALETAETHLEASDWGSDRDMVRHIRKVLGGH